MDSERPKFAVLCSARGLGHYTPGVRLAHELRRLGAYARVDVIESLLSDEQKAKVLAQQKALQGNPAIYRTLAAVTSAVGAPTIAELGAARIRSWKKDSIDTFVTLTGAWVPLINEYQHPLERPLRVRCLHIDCVPSPSWISEPAGHWPHDWLMRAGKFMTVRRPGTIPRNPTKSRVLVHGGGWHLSDLTPIVSDLRRAGYIVTANANRPLPLSAEVANREIRITPSWQAWDIDKTYQGQLPPMEIRSAGQGRRTFVSTGRDMSTLIQCSVCVVSKPGGAALLESLETGTPLVLLPGLAPHETANLTLWQASGFGLTWESWKAEHFSQALLEPLRKNLARARDAARSYPSILLESNDV